MAATVDVLLRLAVVLKQEGEGKTLSSFECPRCAKKNGGQYMYGNVDEDALRERGVAAAAVAETTSQGDEEAGNSELASNTCTWPPPEAEYFFGERAPAFGSLMCRE